MNLITFVTNTMAQLFPKCVFCVCSTTNMYFATIMFICTWALAKETKHNETQRSGQYTDAAPDYKFVAYLFNKQNESVRCTGAVVAPLWILNYCEYGDLKYDAVRVGVKEKLTRTNKIYYIYDIVQRLVHPGHEIQAFPQISPEYDLQSLYASRHSLFLDKTDREMTVVAGIARYINLSRKKELPNQGKTIYFPKSDTSSNDAHYMVLNIKNASLCDDYYQKYNLSMYNDTQYCVDSSSVTFDECCASHAIMEHDNILIGMVAWSTACFTTPEPWVFTNIGIYYDWISLQISGSPMFGRLAHKNRSSIFKIKKI